MSEMSPFSLKGVAKNPSVLPVIGCIVLGCAMAAAYTFRLAIFNPDVSWNQKKNNEPWQAYAKKEYKFYLAEPFDVKNYQHPRPPF